MGTATLGPASTAAQEHPRLLPDALHVDVDLEEVHLAQVARLVRERHEDQLPLSTRGASLGSSLIRASTAWLLGPARSLAFRTPTRGALT